MECVGIVINGEDRTVPAGQSVTDLLVSLGLEPSRVAVELNRAILPRESWSDTPVSAGSRLEIVQFVGGG